MSKRCLQHSSVSTYFTAFPRYSLARRTRSLTRSLNHTAFAPHSLHTSVSARPLYSGLSTTSLIGGIVLSLAGYYFWSTLSASTLANSLEDLSHSEKSVDTSSETPWIRVYPGMPPQIPPGRPGNLTQEQEARLKELWEALMGVCGIVPSSESDTASTTSNRAPIVDQSDKKKHRLGGLLSRKKHDDVASSDSEDKHGLNKEYQQALASQRPEELRETFWTFSKADDPDAVLLRFLRARKWNVHDALVMLVSTIHWRGKVIHLDDDVMKNGEAGALAASTTGSGEEKKLGEDFLMQMRMGKSFLHGTDREGRPLCFVRVKLHRAGEQSNASLERYTVYTIETARFMLRPPVDTAVIVFDMTDFSMANMDYTPVKFMIKVFEANYPESLGAVLVHKAPWVFQGIWSIIKGWLDPVVAAKVNFTKNAAELEQFIDPNHIPKSLGGKEEWEYSYVEANPNENAAMRDVGRRQQVETERAKMVKDYEAATVEWIRSPDGSALQGRRLQIAEALRHNYWKLDPFVRARSLYDRTGTIRQGGVLNFYGEGGMTGSDGAAHQQDDID